MGGFLISFEGTEGCGKSTQIARLAARLEAAGRIVLTTREPGGTPAGERIRDLLQHDDAGEGMSPECELLLFAASRAELARRRLAPALAAGAVALCDRYLDSTTVYQGAARRLPRTAVDAINAFAVGGTRPDLTLLFDLPAEEGLRRVRDRGNGDFDRMEREDAAFFAAVRQGYLDLAAAEPDRFTVIDATRDPDAVEAAVWEAVGARLPAR